MRRKSYPDGILHGGGPHQQPEEKKKEAEACHAQGVVVEVGAEALVQKTRQDQKHLIPEDLGRKLQKQKAKEQKPRKERRMQKGKSNWLNCAH